MICVSVLLFLFLLIYQCCHVVANGPQCCHTETDKLK